MLVCYGEVELSGFHTPFELFFNESVRYLQLAAQCQVKDMNVLRQLIESFFSVAQTEYSRIKVRIEADAKFEIQLTERALAEYNKRQQDPPLLSGKSTNDHDTASMPHQLMDTPMDPGLDGGAQSSALVSNYGTFSGYVPGLNFIRNAVIKPLLFATEKVVESYIGPVPAQ